jgi:hypothetical protein
LHIRCEKSTIFKKFIYGLECVTKNRLYGPVEEDIHYLSYSAGDTRHIAYAKGTSPTRPFTFKGYTSIPSLVGLPIPPSLRFKASGISSISAAHSRAA